MKTVAETEFNLASSKQIPQAFLFPWLFELKSLFASVTSRGKNVFRILAHRIADMANFFHGLYKQTENAV